MPVVVFPATDIVGVPEQVYVAVLADAVPPKIVLLMVTWTLLDAAFWLEAEQVSTQRK